MKLKCTYGSGNTKAICYMYQNWYVVKRSKNVNLAQYETNFYDGIDVEKIRDIDCMTASKPITTEAQLIAMVKRHEKYLQS